jgi:short chain dehydrogenase
MVAIQAIRKSNARIAELPEGLVALFLGATSGIGQSTLIQFAKYAVQPRIYIVARRASATRELLEELHKENLEGTYTVIEKDVSLICETSDVVEFVKTRETKLDLLFESVGFISFTGRQETTEGLEPSMTTRYYSRLRARAGPAAAPQRGREPARGVDPGRRAGGPDEREGPGPSQSWQLLYRQRSGPLGYYAYTGL